MPISIGAQPSSASSIQLQESDRQRLDGIVSKMIANNESDDNIKFVVNDFKQKYGRKIQNKTLLEKAGSAAGQGLKLASKFAFGPIGNLATSEGREAARGAIGSTVQSLAKPIVSTVSGVSGLAGLQIVPKEGVNIPMFGRVSPYETSQGAAATGLAQKMGKNVTPEQVQQTKQTQFSRSLNDLMTGATSYLEVGAPGTGKIAEKLLTKAATKLYQTALKPSTKLAPEVANQIVQTGLKERIWLTQGGVEAVAAKIDGFENMIGDAIEAAKGQGAKINLKGMQGYVDQVKDLFKYDVDVKAAESATKELDSLVSDFAKKYGNEIPIEEAQKIKVATGQQLKKYYDRMTSVGIEGRKQMTRFLKDKIIEKAPIVGDINARLSSLYEFDKALGQASNRINNLNLLSLGGKVLTGAGATLGGAKGAALGLLGGILTSPSIKSGAAIGLDLIGKGSPAAGNAIRVPITAGLNSLLNNKR